MGSSFSLLTPFMCWLEVLHEFAACVSVDH